MILMAIKIPFIEIYIPGNIYVSFAQLRKLYIRIIIFPQNITYPIMLSFFLPEEGTQILSKSHQVSRILTYDCCDFIGQCIVISSLDVFQMALFIIYIKLINTQLHKSKIKNND